MKHIITSAIFLIVALAVQGQQQSSSELRIKAPGTSVKTGRQDTSPREQQRLGHSDRDDTDLQWMRVIYRSLDLTEDANAPLAHPEETGEDTDNLFRTIVKLVADGRLPAYEYIDGRESFTERHKVNPREVLERYGIPFTEAKGSTARTPRYNVESADIPSEEVLSYYLIERWEFDRHENRMRTRVDAICPVIHRQEDFGMEPLRYPVFWIRMNDLKHHADGIVIETSDDNNLTTHTLNDYFALRLYKGDIYKTGNRRNRALARIYQTPEALQHARDSIELRLQAFEKGLWVPSLEEVHADSTDVTAGKASDAGKSVNVRKPAKVSKKKPSKPAKIKRTSTGRSNVTRSVRNRKQ